MSAAARLDDALDVVQHEAALRFDRRCRLAGGRIVALDAAAFEQRPDAAGRRDRVLVAEAFHVDAGAHVGSPHVPVIPPRCWPALMIGIHRWSSFGEEVAELLGRAAACLGAQRQELLLHRLLGQDLLQGRQTSASRCRSAFRPARGCR